MRLKGRKSAEPSALNVSTATRSPSTATTIRPGPGLEIAPPAFRASVAVGTQPARFRLKPTRRLFGATGCDDATVPATASPADVNAARSDTAGAPGGPGGPGLPERKFLVAPERSRTSIPSFLIA